MNGIFHHGTPSLRLRRCAASRPRTARRLADRIPGAELQLTPDDGRLTLYEHGVPGVQDWLSRARG
jgi:hypothetical protein